MKVKSLLLIAMAATLAFSAPALAAGTTSTKGGSTSTTKAKKSAFNPDLINYTFEESATKDSSKGKNDGKAVGKPTVVQDKAFKKKVLVLDGKSYIRIKDKESLSPAKITIASVFSLGTLDGTQDIVAKTQTSDYALEFNPVTKKLEGWLYIESDDGESAEYVVLESKELKKDTIYHAALTFDGHEAVLYMDGKKVASKVKDGSIAQAMIVDLTIGVDPEVDDGARSYMTGKIGYVKIWSKALRAVDIESLYKEWGNRIY
ncbi:LamG-like jellyroll fold domain-containing protein [Paenibacillus thermotolerans]|uniref:LamG-like jellyroll fold domain-containing protein n=1 Tax=Paenibacillus thermotolerans TaxID=3027807 RepID=UPI0023685648|nr:MULTISPECIES: LamG-like jellyroll fold domain-containing protein [unclassified Paenibacillus]